MAVVGTGIMVAQNTAGITLTEDNAGSDIQDFISAILEATNPITPASNTDTAVTADSGDVAATATTATLPGVAGQTTYITGFTVTGAGATAGSTIRITVTGTISGTLGYDYVVPAGATVAAPTFQVTFPTPVPASAPNTAIVVNLPSLGAGNLHAEVNATGFQRLTTAAGATSPANVAVIDVLDCGCGKDGH